MEKRRKEDVSPGNIRWPPIGGGVDPPSQELRRKHGEKGVLKSCPRM